MPPAPASHDGPPRPRLNRRLLNTLAVLTSVCLLAAWHVDSQLSAALGLPPAWHTAWRALLLITALATPAGLLAPWLDRRALRVAVAWPGLILMGWFSTLFILTLLRDLTLVVAAVTALHDAELTQVSARAVALLSLLASTLGYFNARRVPPVKPLDFAHPRISKGLHGLRIVQLSDIHVGPTIRARQIRRLVAACNRLQPDLVVITGDVVDGRPDRLAAAIAEFASLQARHGVFMVPGNHDYYSGIHAWLPVFEQQGIRVLLNTHAVIRHGTGTLYLAGVTDPSAARFVPAQRSDAEAALRGIPPEAAVVMLAHQPVQAHDMPSERILLQLSGHTHGGQFFPWGYAVPLQQPITAGLSDKFGHAVYVSRGTGYWGPPKRLLSPSEITLITLRGSPG